VIAKARGGVTGEALHDGVAWPKADGDARSDERSPAPAWRLERGVGPARSSWRWHRGGSMT
jgi:hypothetical protein